MHTPTSIRCFVPKMECVAKRLPLPCLLLLFFLCGNFIITRKAENIKLSTKKFHYSLEIYQNVCYNYS